MSHSSYQKQNLIHQSYCKESDKGIEAKNKTIDKVSFPIFLPHIDCKTFHNSNLFLLGLNVLFFSYDSFLSSFIHI